MIIFRNNESNENKTNVDNNVERVEANVKWYNPEKGYGFLIRDDNSSDIMIHFSVLDAMGCPYVKEGDRVICNIAPGRCGLQVIRVIEVKFGSPEPRSLSDFLESQLTPFDLEDLEEVEGVIKWYNPDKGYGFILPDDERREIFLHTSVIRAAGYRSLEPGIRVLAKVFTSERGQEARIITVLDEEEKKEEKTQAS